MRLSVDRDDSGFLGLAIAARARVLVDGVYCPDCVTADEERGFVIYLVRDQFGRFVIDGDRVLRKVHFGRVELEIAAADKGESWRV